jgi:hypothetical protein
MSTTRSLAGAAALVLVALGALSCENPDADLVVQIHRGSREGGADLYVCGDGPLTRCKHFVPFSPASAATLSEVGIFVGDATTRLNLQLQLQQPPGCGHFFVTFAQDKVIQVNLDPAGSDPYSVSDCASCTAIASPCTWPTRL